MVRLTGADLPWHFYLILGMAVWVLYTFDHLIDAARLKEQANTPRHLYHYKYAGPLAFVMLMLVGPASVILAYLNLGWEAMGFGFVMGVFAVLHFALVSWVADKTAPWLMKELGVAMVYVLGIWGLPLMESGAWESTLIVLMLGQYLLLALVNLLEFSLYEVEIDELDGHTSFVRAVGPKRARLVIRLFLGLILVIAVLVLVFSPAWTLYWAVQGIFLLMLAILALLLIFPDWFQKFERYRSFGDGAFLLPFLLVFYPSAI